MGHQGKMSTSQAHGTMFWHGCCYVDDGLEWDHDDLKTNYESTLDYDYCNYDGNPEPAGWDAHGTAAESTGNRARS